MSKPLRFLFSTLILSTLGLASSPAWAMSCIEMHNVAEEDSYKAKAEDIEKCIMKGEVDPPVNWRPDNGRGRITEVGGSGGHISTVNQAPDKPPAVRGYGPSVSDAKMKFSLKFPPWKGFPCQVPGGIDLCGGDEDSNSNDPTGGDGSTGGVVSSCPIATDTSGTFGQMQTISGTGNYDLACGAGVPLSTYQMTLVTNPDGVVATEYNSAYLWVYKRSGNAYTGTGTPVALPSYLCKPGPGGAMERSVTVSPPRAQFITYNANSTHLAIRLIPATPTPGETEEELPEPPPAFSPAANAEKYLIIPVRGGMPEVPLDCALEDDYLKTAAAVSGELVVETELTPACEGTAAQCASIGASTSPTAMPNCSTVSLNLAGNTPETAACDGMIQMLVLERPNLLFPFNSRPSFATIDGRTARMASTVADSKLYLPTGHMLRIPQSGQRFTLDEGGTLALNGGTLVMFGPVTIDSGSGQITLTAGGEFRDDAGNTVSTYPANSSTTTTGGFPMLVMANRNMSLPVGYDIPTQPAPYIRAPIATQ